MQGIQEIQTQKTSGPSDDVKKPFEAKTLKSISEIISVIGWLVVGLGALAVAGSIVIGILVSINDQDNVNTIIFGGFLSGLGLAFIGLLVVSCGQLITCFVQIERNTNEIVEKMRQLR